MVILMNKLRRTIQLISAALANGYLFGFAKGNIFTGNSKAVCVPFLNCYSCPGAFGACPIGGLQAVLGDRNYKFSFYILGFLMLFGILVGRLICGFMCPFGFLQDLLFKIKTPKFQLKASVDKYLRYLKYIILVLLVILLPLLLTDDFGTGAPYFCKWLCPAGTLEGGIPLIIANESLRKTLGFLFSWKLTILIIVIVLSIISYRPFCKYLCPLGAFYGLFNRYSFLKLEIDYSKCTGCNQCSNSCKMQVNLTKNCNSTECIRCGECMDNCMQEAIKFKLY